ncbi:hypothetical protein IFM89_010464 [Coptis chinensis]|uniref:Uncharacterized protein n=1 Tax=Coptis chinensis TaxID=261450 RepID=A0A835LV62_9MAGN|nr:hypothetical protein IFM89_010464 [Coptis chinensis]
MTLLLECRLCSGIPIQPPHGGDMYSILWSWLNLADLDAPTQANRSRNEEFRLCRPPRAWGKRVDCHACGGRRTVTNRQFEKGMGRGETNGGGGPFFRAAKLSRSANTAEDRVSLRLAKMVKEQLGPSMSVVCTPRRCHLWSGSSFGRGSGKEPKLKNKHYRERNKG